MAWFEVLLEELSWHTACVLVEAETLTEAMEVATSAEEMRAANWNCSETVETRVLKVSPGHDNSCELYVCDIEEREPFAVDVTLDISSLDRDPAAAQALWDQMMLERRTAKAMGQSKASRL